VQGLKSERQQAELGFPQSPSRTDPRALFAPPRSEALGGHHLTYLSPLCAQTGRGRLWGTWDPAHPAGCKTHGTPQGPQPAKRGASKVSAALELTEGPDWPLLGAHTAQPRTRN
jgi:hypothetical protein